MTTEYTPYLTPDGQKAEAEALGWLRENDPRSPAEQAALDAINSRRWILWHANDRDLGVILLLSRLELLRDKAQEEHLNRWGQANADRVARDRHVDAQVIRYLSDLITDAANQIDAGTDPAEVSAGLRDIQNKIFAAQERAKAKLASDNDSTAANSQPGQAA